MLIDCPPNLYQCSWNAILAADYVVIPVPPEDFGTQGLRAVHLAVRQAQQLNPELDLRGHLITRVDRRLQIHCYYIEKLREIYGCGVLQTTVPEAVAFKLSLSFRTPVTLHQPRSVASESMVRLAHELFGTSLPRQTGAEATCTMSRSLQALKNIEGQLSESMGVRAASEQNAPSALQADPKDIGRRPLPEVAEVDITQVIADPEQPRTEFSEEALTSLAESIRERGQFSPILVRWSDRHQKWVIIAGERRWRATRLAGLTTISCHCRVDAYSDSEVLEQQLIENCLREDLSPVEEARAFRRLVQLNNWTGKQVAESLRVSPTQVSRALALLKLPDDLLQSVEAGQLSSRAAYELTRLPTPEAQRRMAHQIAQQSMTAVQASNAVRKQRGKKGQRREKKKLTFVSESGHQLVIHPRKAANYAEIEEFILEVLDEIRLRRDSNIQV